MKVLRKIISELRGTKRFITLVITFSLILLSVASHTEITNRFLIEFETKSLFAFRQLINRPQIDPRIKIFSIDDRAVATLKTLSPPLDFWTTILRALEDAKVASITIDKIFDSPDLKTAETGRFTEALQDLKVPIFTIGFATSWEIPLRPRYRSPHMTTQVENSSRKMHFYGPNPALEPVFNKVGHAVYDSTGFIDGIYESSDSTALPHISGHIANLVGTKGPKAEKQFVNFIPRDQLKKVTFSILPLYALAQSGRTIPVLSPGDHVIILPAMYTGNTDWKNSPFGRIEGGYILAATVNAALQSRWPVFLQNSAAFVLLFAIIAIAVQKLTLKTAGITSTAIVAGYILATHMLFALLDIIVPVTLPVASFSIVAIGLFALRLERRAVDQARMKSELNTARIVQDSFFDNGPGGRSRQTVYRKSMEECCGDWWKKVILGDHRELYILADATGHGAPAAIVTAMAYATVNAICESERKENISARYILHRLNSMLCSTMGSSKTSMSAIALIVDHAEKTMEVSNAGHPFPLFASGGKLKPIRLAGNPAGIIESSEYKSIQLTFEHGDRLILYTDGIVECSNPEGVQFGNSRFRKACDEGTSADSDAFVKNLVERVDSFCKGAPSTDDVTLIVIDL